MTVNNACARRPQRGLTLQGGLHGLGLGCRQQAQLIGTQNAIGIGLGLNGSQLGNLGCRGGHDQFTALFVGYVALLAIAVKQFSALYTKLGFQRTRWVINARVNHFTVARTGTRSKSICRLQEQHLTAFQ